MVQDSLIHVFFLTINLLGPLFRRFSVPVDSLPLGRAHPFIAAPTRFIEVDLV